MKRFGLAHGLRAAYMALTWLVAPLLLIHLYWRGRRVPGYRQRIGERFGLGLPQPAGRPVWLHAVSVGEVQAAVPLVRALLERYPDVPLVVTTMTPTGSARVRAVFGDAVTHVYVPYDLPSAVRRFFDRIRPRLAIIMETEIWPGLYHECGRRNVPLVLASARISARSLRRYRRLVPLFRDTLANGIVIAAQSEADAGRFISLGASPARTHVTGNLKFDFDLPEDVARQGERLRQHHAAGRPVWIAASTHDGEEAMVLAAHRRVLEAIPDALLLLVPRHPERFAAVAALIDAAPFGFVTRSSGLRADAGVEVFLGDTMGELLVFYAAADVAFVGGSLVAVGGHNMLEPVALGVPVVAGPCNDNAADIAGLLIECGAVEIVEGAEGLAAAVRRLLGDEATRRTRSRLGLDTLTVGRGALDRLLALIGPMID